MNKQLEDNLSEVLVAAKKNDVSLDPDLIRKAFEFADMAHTGQKRKSGEDYIYHPLAVCRILISWKLDQTSILAAILHDSIDDGGATDKDLVTEFGKEVSSLVEGVTKVSNLRLRGSRDSEFVENMRKMFLSMAQDIRVVLVKLADRLHNMRTLGSLPNDKQVKIAQETLEVFAPLAERLGMGEVKAELEDLAFPYVYPKEHKRVVKESRLRYKKAAKHLLTMKHKILRALEVEGIRAEVNTREKHLYSLWRKLERDGVDWDFNNVNDIVAIRIITENVSDCYVALGVVHLLYKPVPKLGISDYIAQPKPNGYRSIHTKVFGPGEQITEVQIRSREMHEQAEYGVAAHWAYSEEKSKPGASSKMLKKEGVKASGAKLTWIKQLAEWQKDVKDSKEFLDTVKFDAFGKRNFVFSPKGDVYDLPSDATPIDFAFAVHTQLGEYIGGAKVNGKMVPLNHTLKSGDVVEIIKSKNPRKPSRDWLSFVVTAQSRREIGKLLRDK